MFRKTDLAVFAVLLALSESACGGARTSTNSESPAHSVVVLPSGVSYELEIAATPDLRAEGLMFRESLAGRHGMLFLFPKPSVESFWMKNCNFPIDIVWLDAARRVTFVSANTPPCREDPCPTYGPKTEALYVLEIPAGAAAAEKITVGSELKFENVPELPKE